MPVILEVLRVASFCECIDIDKKNRNVESRTAGAAMRLSAKSKQASAMQAMEIHAGDAPSACSVYFREGHYTNARNARCIDLWCFESLSFCLRRAGMGGKENKVFATYDTLLVSCLGD